MKSNKWDIDTISDLKGRIAVVTGSSSGIGHEAARVLADKNAEVIIAVRNRDKGDAAVQKIKEQNRNADVKLMLLDLASLKSIKIFADEFKKKYRKLNLLINNAGVMIPPYSKTEDGFELQFGTNHLGHFSLTLQLLDLINHTDGSRIVNISSMAHKYGKINFDDLTWEKRKYKPARAYGDSKIANLYFTFELQRKLEQSGSKIQVTAAHPGWTATDLQRHSGIAEFLNKFFAMTIGQGALPTLRAALDENAKGGDYFGPHGFMEMRGNPVKVKASKLARDTAIAGKLWEVSETLTGTRFNI